MRVLAPAKINLHLRVGPPRADGFHPLRSWMCTVGLFDTLIIEPSPADGVRLVCDSAGLPTDSNNLVVKAAAALAGSLAVAREGDASGRRGLSVRLQKRIPVGAGLGGGSSDGAHVLLALNVLWGLGWSRVRLAAFAARFGSDLPFFMYAPSAVCEGRGEEVRPLRPPAPAFALLVLPGRALSTPAVYRRFDEMGLGSSEVLRDAPDLAGWTRLAASVLLPMLVNDLEPAAFALDPELGELRRNLQRWLGRTVRMSGSGTSLFTLYDTRQEAESAALKMRTDHDVQAMAVQTAPSVEDDLNAARTEK